MERVFQFQAENVKSGSNIRIDKTQIKASFDSSDILLSLGGNIIRYDDQRLTVNGLQIMKEKDGHPISSFLQFNTSVQLDEKVKEHKYCIEIAKSVDRLSNSAAIIASRERNTPAKSYSLQSCQFLIKKIPLKPICFLTVFRYLKIQKIKILLEDNSFFLQIFKYLCDVIYKVNLDELLIEGKQNKQGKFERKQINQKQKKLTHLYRQVISQIRNHPFAYQRISILIQNLFTYPSNIANYLNKINQSFISQLINQEINSLLKPDSKQLNIIAKPVRLILENINSMIKNTFFYIGKSSKAFQILDSSIIQKFPFQQWVSQSLQKIESDQNISQQLIKLLTWLFEINKKKANLIYSLNFQKLNQIIKSEVQISYENLYSFFNQNDKVEKEKRQLSIQSLKNLKMICSITINEQGKAGNIGVMICKYIYEIAPQLNEKDIQLLTFACFSNKYLRSYLLKYLVKYFQKFIRKLKSKIKYSLDFLKIKEVRKEKHVLLAIIQSVIKISEINSIQIDLQKNFLPDLLELLQNGRFLSKSKNLRIFNLGCIGSAYLSLVNKIQLKQIQNKIAY